jgi:hypothetical protein
VSAFAEHAEDYPTGPLDFNDLDALSRDPYLRDAAGRFAPHPADRPVRVVRFGAGDVASVSYEDGSRYTPVPPRPGFRRGSAR